MTPGKGRAFDSIPLINIAPMFGADEEAKARTAREIAKAASEVGFLYVTGHGVPEAMIERLKAKAAAFFALPLETKQKYYIGNSRAHRGYVPTAEEAFYNGEVPKIDKKEAFDLSVELAADDPDHIKGYRLLGPNQWPAEVEDFRKDVYAYYEAAIGLGHTLFRAFALSLGLEEDYFERFLKKPPSQLRLVHYPENPADAAAAASEWGISAHTDYECFTILHATTPGLEVLNAEGRWIDAPPVPGAFVINIGDMMEALTNGRFIATPHRVRNVSEERYSFPLFCALDYETVIEPLPKFIAAGEPPRYGRYVAGDHLLAQTMLTFAYLRRLRADGKLALPGGARDNTSTFGRREEVRP
ncbi:MAG: 2-oxoglutarate and iron-dependent oxygenase domain-containing protein [Parvibaculum sp.]|uniref:isopenicillin N synthase family dioxygenase n=1 Tax=Parvibaculum sp. TaxID=2024848 RepID=UPI00284839F5|nr:2-oxoglutarate and iron-dependent oxygenase domain-containing protein [Parvibaculum sp.]MDR3500203.1 2-oxoglutarate and iron-dependent oxygenase domain-containing protein [Parvibaculum sp.]